MGAGIRTRIVKIGNSQEIRIPKTLLEQSGIDEEVEIEVEDDRYEIVNHSRYFPNINISDILTECFQIAADRNTSTAIRELRRKLESEA